MALEEEKIMEGGEYDIATNKDGHQPLSDALSNTQEKNSGLADEHAVVSPAGEEGEEGEKKKEEEIKGWGFSDPRLRPFVVISITYLLFTVTDGAIRMIVLLHAYNKSFSALEVAVMFTLYELAGVFTNLAAGMMGARWGIRFTLIIGLCLQILSYGTIVWLAG